MQLIQSARALGRLSSLLFVSTLMGFVGAQTAQAGEYHTIVCGHPVGAGGPGIGDALTAAGNSETIEVVVNCDANPRWAIRARLHHGASWSVEQNMQKGAWFGGGVELRTPPNTTIVRIQTDNGRWFNNPGRNWNVGIYLDQAHCWAAGWERSPGSASYANACAGAQHSAPNLGEANWDNGGLDRGGLNFTMPRPESIGNINYAFIGVSCQGPFAVNTSGCYRGEGASSGGISFTNFDATVYDGSAPVFSQGVTADGNWRKPGAVGYSAVAVDNTGIRQFLTFVDGTLQSAADQGCNYTNSKPCADRGISASVPVGGSWDGRHSILVRAWDASQAGLIEGVNSTDSAADVHTDGTAPGKPAVAAAQGTSWRRVNGFDLNAPVPTTESDPDGAGPRGQSPIVQRKLTLCQVTSADCVDTTPAATGNVASVKVNVQGEGDWKARLTLTDQAGNTGVPSDWVPLRLDTTAPTVSASNAPTGTALRLSAVDGLSGLVPAADALPVESGAWIRYRLDGGAWTTARPTSDGKTGSVDVTVSEGRHTVEVQAADAAGNASAPQQFELVASGERGPSNGAIPGLSLNADGTFDGALPAIKANVVAWYDTKSKTKPRPVTKVIGLGDEVIVRGRLTTEAGAGIPNASIDVAVTIPAGPTTVLTDQAKTNADGDFSLVLPKGQTSRMLALRWRARANDAQPTATASLKLSVRPKVTLAVSSARIGKVTAFTGSTTPVFLPKRGKSVELQYLRGKRWVTFRTTRTDKAGKWRLTHRFSTRATWQIRALVPFELGYPFQGRSTTPKRVSVR